MQPAVDALCLVAVFRRWFRKMNNQQELEIAVLKEQMKSKDDLAEERRRGQDALQEKDQTWSEKYDKLQEKLWQTEREKSAILQVHATARRLAALLSRQPFLKTIRPPVHSNSACNCIVP